MGGPFKPDLGLSGAVRQLELHLRGHLVLVGAADPLRVRLRGGPIELEQMDSADPRLAVHGLYGGSHREHRGRSTEEVQHLGGPLGGGSARLSPFHRSVLVRAAVCQQVAQRATHRLNRRLTSCAFGDDQRDVVGLFMRAESSSLICNCYQQLRQG